MSEHAVSLIDRLKWAGRQAKSASEAAGRAALDRAMQSPAVREQVEKAQHLIDEARKSFEQKLNELEAQLWAYVEKARQEAQKAGRQARRRRDADHHYRVLGLKPGANLADVKAAWREKMRAHHPDRFASDPRAEARAHAMAQELNIAYQELTALLTGRESRKS